jgi:hypothetical protein
LIFFVAIATGREEQKMKNNTIGKVILSAMTLVSMSFAVASASISNDFESMTLGAIPGGVSGQAAGNGAWWNPDNSATYGEVKTGIGISGSQGLEIGNRGNGFDGVIDNVKSAMLSETAGESVSPANAPNNIFRSVFHFRTASTSAIADSSDSQATRYRFRSESYGPDRTTFFGVSNDASGNLNASGFGMDDAGNFIQTSLSANLSWGEWYRVETLINFVDGGPANDSVVYSLFDSSNALIWSANSTSWEQGVRLFNYNGGNIFGVDRVQFHARGSMAGLNGATYVDNLSYEAVPEPFTMAGLAALGLVAARRKSRKS